MCAIIGAVMVAPTQSSLDTLKKVFVESKIRGMHATGVSYIKDSVVYTIKEGIPADQFMAKIDFNDMINEDGNLYLVGHCRYSTSDLLYNQPIANEEVSVAHNGVITQEPYSLWKEHYNMDCQTHNDTELILQSVLAGLEPLSHWKDASMSVCELHSNKTLHLYRNGKRPMTLNLIDDQTLIVTSTKDIARRAGINGSTETTAYDKLTVTIEGDKIAYINTHFESDNRDLQPKDNT